MRVCESTTPYRYDWTRYDKLSQDSCKGHVRLVQQSGSSGTVDNGHQQLLKLRVTVDDGRFLKEVHHYQGRQWSRTGVSSA